MKPRPYDPREHIQHLELAPRAEEILDQREITIRSYKTTVPFDAKAIDAGIDRGWLSPSIRFGVFSRSSSIAGKTSRAVVLGLQDSLSVRAYDYDARRPLWYSWRDIIVDTVSVRYDKDEDGLLRFTTAGGGQRITDERLHEFNSTYLGIPKESVTKRQFNLEKLRDLCFRRFLDRLYMVRFSDPEGEEYRSIDHALFQSRQYIDPDVKRMRDVRADKQAKIESFDSDIPVRAPELAGPVQVRFFIRGMSGSLRLRFPKLAFAKNCETADAQAEVFYAVVNAAVDSILDADYYAEHQDTLQDLEREAECFPEMADLARFAKVLSSSKNRADFLQSFDIGSPRGNWLPHLRALDGLLSSVKVEDHVRDLLAARTAQSPSTAVKLLLECRADPALFRLGRVTAAVLKDKLQSFSPVIRAQAEEALLAWYVDHEVDAWGIDPIGEAITVGNLRWRSADLSLDALAAVLQKMISAVLHGRLIATKGDLGPLLTQFNWCVAAAKALSPNFSKLSAALRLLAENRLPTSISEGAAILKSPPSDLPTLDDAMLHDFGLPLWPTFEAVREDGHIKVRNIGIGVALDLAASPSGTLFGKAETSDVCDLRPGEHVLVPPTGSPTRIDVRFAKFGSARMAEVPVHKAPQTKTPSETKTSEDRYGWIRQADLARALHRVLGAEDSPSKATLTRAVQQGQIKSNGESGHQCRLHVDSVKAWLTKTRELQHDEIQQIADAMIAEIRDRKQ